MLILNQSRNQLSGLLTTQDPCVALTHSFPPVGAHVRTIPPTVITITTSSWAPNTKIGRILPTIKPLALHFCNKVVSCGITVAAISIPICTAVVVRTAAEELAGDSGGDRKDANSKDAKELHLWPRLSSLGWIGIVRMQKRLEER